MDEVKLIRKEGQLLLQLTSEKGLPTFAPDFSSETMRMKIKDELKRRGLLLRAVEGKTHGRELKIFDFYSGFAQDAFLLACAGFDVISMEKNPVISQVTKAAWESQKSTPWMEELQPKLTLLEGDSFQYLAESKENFDVIYMDPMFMKLKGKAKSPLPMQMIQALLKDEPPGDVEKELELALNRAAKVVMKTPLKSRLNLKRKPSYQLEGKTIRFDIF